MVQSDEQQKVEKVCIIGSLRFHKRMLEISTLLTTQGIPHSLPVPGRYREPSDPGKYVRNYDDIPFNEKLKEEQSRMHAHFDKIKASTIIYIVNPDGYIGVNSATEILWAAWNHKLIYAQQSIQDQRTLWLMSYVKAVLTPDELARRLSNKRLIRVTH